MKITETDIFVFADWIGMSEPICIGVLKATSLRGKTVFSFEYAKEWLKSNERFVLDPDIQWYSGPQFPARKTNFGIFFDSMPDTWGRTLMKRKAAQAALSANNKPPVLRDRDFLLGVHDFTRMGALRFKTDVNGSFLDDNNAQSVPPWSSIRELQHAANIVQSDTESLEINKWLSILLAPGSSLGGDRPKANILDEHNQLWIAKFPSQNDVIDKAAWEYLAYQLALKAGVNMAECRIEKVSSDYHTFFTKRFDRIGDKRIHFASAMTMTGNDESTIRDTTVSYLEIAEFIRFSGGNIKQDLEQLWRRIVFNIAVSNTDDHLRNHGFIIKDNQWRLSPAYDINPSTDKNGLALNIDLYNNSLDFDLAMSVGEYFQLNAEKMKTIIREVCTAVSQWDNVADNIGISRAEKELMRQAFRF